MLLTSVIAAVQLYKADCTAVAVSCTLSGRCLQRLAQFNIPCLHRINSVKAILAGKGLCMLISDYPGVYLIAVFSNGSDKQSKYQRVFT